MSKLHLSTDLSVPIDACTQTFAWIGRKGSGKTYGAGKLVEELMDHDVQVVILDTVGNWYGLRLSSDGKPTGYEIPVFGGLRQDLPLLATAGEVVADVVIDSQRSVILDVSQFNFSERKRFAADFGTRLWQRKKGESQPSPLHLIIEECQLIVPQFVGKDDTRMVHVYEEIIRLGRNYGIGISMLTQRPQSVNKEVLTQAECIMAFQLNGVPERKALKDWLTYEGGDVNLVNELPGLAVGTCYLWSPQWLHKFEKITIAKKTTFDASATPKMGAKTIRRDPAPLDVKDIEARMVSTIEKAKADDPRLLKQEIAKLKAELQRTPVAAIPPSKVKEVPVLKGKQLAQLETFCTKLMREAERHGSAMSIFWSNLNQVAESLLKAIKSVSQERSVVAVTSHRDTRMIQAPMHIHRQESISDAEIGKSGLRRMLVALAQRSVGLTKRQLGVRAGLSSQTGTFSTYLSKAKSNGWMAEQAGVLVITEKGLAALGDYAPLPAGKDLLLYWLSELGESGAGRMLHVLSKVYPSTMTKERLGVEANLSPTTGTFSTYLSKLRALQLIEGSREIRASEELFL